MFNMNKTFLLAISTVFLIGCSNPREIIDPNLPAGLSDCKVYRTDYGTVVRCPNSSTSNQYMHGRVMTSNTVIEDTITVTVPTQKKYVLTK